MKHGIEYDLYNLAKKVDKTTLQETSSWAVPLPGRFFITEFICELALSLMTRMMYIVEVYSFIFIKHHSIAVLGLTHVKVI